MIGRSHGSIITGTNVLLRRASVASARTQRESTDFFDHSTTTAFAVAQCLLRHLVVGLAGAQRGVPPDGETSRLERLGKAARCRLILAVIGQKNVGQA